MTPIQSLLLLLKACRKPGLAHTHTSVNYSILRQCLRLYTGHLWHSLLLHLNEDLVLSTDSLHFVATVPQQEGVQTKQPRDAIEAWFQIEVVLEILLLPDTTLPRLLHQTAGCAVHDSYDQVQEQ